MVGGIYTADPEKLSLRATMPRFLELEREHRSLILGLRQQNKTAVVKDAEIGQGTSGARYSLFLSFDTGMQLLTDKLEERILSFNSAAGGLGQTCIRLNTTVKSLTREREGEEVGLAFERLRAGLAVDEGEVELRADRVQGRRISRVRVATINPTTP